MRTYVAWLAVTIFIFVLSASFRKKLAMKNMTLSPIIFRNYLECDCDNMKTDEECGFLRNKSDIVHGSLYPPGLREAPCLLMNKWIVQESPLFSIILTVHNQESVIGDTVLHILNFTTESYELIVVFDDCRDKSIENVIESLSGILPNNLCHIMLVKQNTPVFETTANNIGMRASIGKYWMIIQDDMDVVYKGWNSAAASVLRIYGDVIAVSMRASHNIYSHDGGYVGAYVGMDSKHENCTLYVRDSVNRGPLLLRGDMTMKLGYLDEKHFYLGNDDHDLMARAYVNKGWVCGFFHVPNSIDIVAGNTRKLHNRTSSEEKYIEIRQQHQDSFLRNITESKSVRSHDHQRLVPPSYGCEHKHEWFLNVVD